MAGHFPQTAAAQQWAFACPFQRQVACRAGAPIEWRNSFIHEIGGEEATMILSSKGGEGFKPIWNGRADYSRVPVDRAFSSSAQNNSIRGR